MNDKIFFIIFYIVIAINTIFIWMRIILKKKGQDYSYTDFSWSVYYSYLDQMTRDRELKSKFHRFILIDFLILIFISILTILI